MNCLNLYLQQQNIQHALSNLVDLCKLTKKTLCLASIIISTSNTMFNKMSIIQKVERKTSLYKKYTKCITAVDVF